MGVEIDVIAIKTNFAVSEVVYGVVSVKKDCAENILISYACNIVALDKYDTVVHFFL